MATCSNEGFLFGQWESSPLREEVFGWPVLDPVSDRSAGKSTNAFGCFRLRVLLRSPRQHMSVVEALL